MKVADDGRMDQVDDALDSPLVTVHRRRDETGELIVQVLRNCHDPYIASDTAA